MAEKRSKRSRRKVWLVVLVILILSCGLAGYALYRVFKGRDVKFLNQARILMRRGEARQARQLIERALKTNPKSLDARVSLVRVFVQLKEFDRAVKELDRAESLAKELKEPGPLGAMVWNLERARIFLAKADYRLRSVLGDDTQPECESIIADDLAKALNLIDEHLSSPQKSVEGYMLRGIVLRKKVDVLDVVRQKVGEEIRVAQGLQQEDVVKQKWREVARLVREMRIALRESADAYHRALDMDPDATQARLQLAKLNMGVPMALPNLRGILAVLQPILDKKPDAKAPAAKKQVYAEALLTSGWVHKLLGDRDKALEQFRLVEDDSQWKVGALFYEADLLLDAGKLDEADDAAEKYASKSRDKSDPQILYLRGRVLKERGRWVEAVENLQNAFAVRKHWPRARYELAEALLKCDRRERALQAYRDTVADVDLLLPQDLQTPPALLRMLQEDLQLRYASCVKLAKELMRENTEEAAQYAVKALISAPTRREAYELARDALRKAKQPKRISQALYRHADALRRFRRFDEAISAVREDRVLLPDKLAADGFTAATLEAKGAYSEAEKVYQEMLAAHLAAKAKTVRAGIQEGLAGLYRRVGRNDEAEALYAEILLGRRPKQGENLDGLFPQILQADLSRVGAVDGLTMLLDATGRTDKAVEILRTAVMRDKRAAGLTTRLLGIYRRQRNYDSAISFMKTQVDANPDNAVPLATLASLAWLKGDRAGAREYCDKALKLDPMLPAAYQRVLLDLVEGKHDEALKLAEQAVSQSRNRVEATYLLALANQAKGDLSTAQELFRSLYYSRGPFRRVAGRMLVYIFAAEGRIKPRLPSVEPGEGPSAPSAEPGQPQGTDLTEEEARALTKSLVVVLSAAPPDVRQKAALAANLMQAAQYMGLTEEALGQARTMVTLLPKHPLPRCQCALLLDRLGRHEEAVKTYKRVVEDYPDFGLAARVLARSHRAKKENQAAIAVLEAAVKRGIGAAEKATAYFALGQTHQLMGNLDAAVQSYQAASEHPMPIAKSVALNNLAWLLATHKGDLDTALVSAKQAVELNKRDAHVADTLGWIHYLRKDYAESLKYLTRAMTAPAFLRNPSMRARLGLAYWKAGENDKDKAEAELTEALWLARSFPEAEEAKKALKTLRGGQ